MNDCKSGSLVIDEKQASPSIGLDGEKRRLSALEEIPTTCLQYALEVEARSGIQSGRTGLFTLHLTQRYRCRRHCRRYCHRQQVQHRPFISKEGKNHVQDKETHV